MLSDTVNQEQLEKDINFINNYPISKLIEILPELGRSSTEKLKFSDSEFEHRKLDKIARDIFTIFEEKISPNMVKRIDEYIGGCGLSFISLNGNMELYRKSGISSGILIRICIGNLVCYGREDNPFKELHEKYIDDNPKRENFRPVVRHRVHKE